MLYAALSFFFFFNDTATTEIYTLFPTRRSSDLSGHGHPADRTRSHGPWSAPCAIRPTIRDFSVGDYLRSEEHTSELQSLAYLVCRLLLEKKKKNSKHHTIRCVVCHVGDSRFNSR